MGYTAFMLLTALPAWLALPRSTRDEIAGKLPTDAAVEVRFYDAEAFSARCSDVAVFATDDLAAYYRLVEALRDSPLFAEPYFRVEDVILSIEDGHRMVAG
ncbi:hypothetical protein GCM10023148_25870 [Actinokineospora soli]